MCICFTWGSCYNSDSDSVGLRLGLRVKAKVAQVCPPLCNPMDCSPQDPPGQNTGVGSLSLLQGIFPTQGSKPGLPHCRWVLYQLSHKGSPWILEWVTYPFSSLSSWLRNQATCTAGGFFTNWAIRGAPSLGLGFCISHKLQMMSTLLVWRPHIEEGSKRRSSEVNNIM